jgi:putative transposase
VLGQHRSTQRKAPQDHSDEAALATAIVALASEYGRYGYRRITALLRNAGWAVNAKRVERLWARLKEWRAVATCYEKTARSFLGILCLAATLDWIRN